MSSIKIIFHEANVTGTSPEAGGKKKRGLTATCHAKYRVSRNKIKNQHWHNIQKISLTQRWMGAKEVGQDKNIEWHEKIAIIFCSDKLFICLCYNHAERRGVARKTRGRNDDQDEREDQEDWDEWERFRWKRAKEEEKGNGCKSGHRRAKQA